MEQVAEFKVGDKVWVEIMKVSTIVAQLKVIEDIKGLESPRFREQLVLSVMLFIDNRIV